MFSYGWALWASGNYDKAIEAAFKSLNLYKELKNNERMVSSYIQLADFYRDAGDFEEALKYGMLSKNLFESPAVSQKMVGIYPIHHHRIHLSFHESFGFCFILYFQSI